MLFLSYFLLIKIIISLIILSVLVFLLLVKKELLLSSETFARFEDVKRLVKALLILYFASLSLFIIHELSEIVPSIYLFSSDQLSYFFLRHNLIYFALIPFQGLALYLIVKALRRSG